MENIFCVDQKQNKLAAIETHHLVLYAVEPGIFSAYFVRPEDAFIKLSSQLVIHHTLDLFDESVKGNWNKCLGSLQMFHFTMGIQNKQHAVSFAQYCFSINVMVGVHFKSWN